ncbi:signal recognition particle-docking protein FtsY [archaeon CG10_big_fil_rev_8_21_14_0_10_43_11]|nr:MAG: signal recognition particle-docking protein FtsY [archaeon CG10_big_fil_rev_8_21_14_0_10_43_11]
MFGKLKNIFKKSVTTVKKTITEKTLTKDEFEKIFWDLELELIQANVAPHVIDLLKNELEAQLVDVKLKKRTFESVLKTSLKNVLSQTIQTADFIKHLKTLSKPVTILFVGFNGAGKTTTLAKVAHLLKNHKMSCVLAAGDTFRAASIEQLETHAQNLGVRLVKHDYGADSAAVAFDALKHAQAKGLDCVLIDTAGRSHQNVNLMNELKKIKRVIQPDLTLLVIDSLTGSDSVNQAKLFDEAVGVDGLILSKTDSDTKGGTILSVSYLLSKPIFFLGTGQSYHDLESAHVDRLVLDLFD